jgi:proteasome assembly chaperone (PAC2) family protein
VTLNFLQRPTLRNPILLVAFSGWVDGGQVSTMALRSLIEMWGAEKFAEIDPEEFYNFTRARPQVHLEPDLSRAITWPETAFYYHSDPNLERDFVLLIGIEPNFKWRTFTDEVLEVCREVGVSTALSLGGVIADVAHTRAARITVFSSDPDLQARFPEVARRRGAYQGPTGIIGVIMDGLTRMDVPVGNMRGAVPHYIAGSRNAKVSLALLSRLNELYGLGLDLAELRRESRRFERQVNEFLTSTPDVAEHVRSLEAHSDEPQPEGPPASTGGSEELPSGQDIIRQFEEFLRERSSGEGDGDSSDPQSS